jgi:DNA/RNA-binding domain of Phe-tRNA-synthetase-like protein
MARGGGVNGREAVATFAPATGWCAHEVARELPGLSVVAVEAQVQRRGSLTGTSPGDVRSRLHELSNRTRGATAVTMRQQPIAGAYRVFFRHIGLDPDIVRTPMEAAVFERMLRGGFLSAGLLADVLLIALVDTGVPVWALEAESVSGALGIRSSGRGERLGRAKSAPELAAGRLVVADDRSPVAVLFGELAPGHEPAPGSRRVMLFALQVDGVPELYVEEALWSVTAALGAR